MDADGELPGRAHPNEPVYTGLSKPGSFRQLTCGRPKNSPSSNPNRIINGVLARKNSWPWIGAMMREPDFQFCGSSLISDQWVLTAGHCIDSFTDDKIIETVKIIFGVEDLTAATPANKYRVTKVIRHEKYNNPVGSTSNDIALLKLDRKVHISNDTMPACLPTKSVFEKPYVQTAPNNRRICYVAGWGHLVSGQHGDTGGKIGAGTDQLQQVALEIMSTDDCKAFLKGLYTEKTFCAGHDSGKYDSCRGDSGGPVVCDDGPEHGWSLHGIVSWGFGCGQPKAPAAHTHVALMLDWIYANIPS
ncbi:hypothetical protein RvY_08086 [Ramazzottius varieornatus]|uniref:Peptidase S1 domain-containing protein n=1 Tax=Ramazzottius varieornatus TaxID=947166 RepID=A0A1D1V9D0_RAMVA|nr:hypothetical protein RvY_08086 [Ramazzottius varieornatus]